MDSKSQAFVKRASFSKVELTPEQIAHVSGGPACDSSSTSWSIVPTWRDNRPDSKEVCTDY